MGSDIRRGAEGENGWQRRLQERLRETESIISRWLPEETGHQKLIFQAMNYSVLAGGKRLRPMLMKEVYRLFGGQGQEIEPFMAAIEMIHTSSLVHDDLPAMDADEYRRGKKTTWVAYGEDMAILAGDALMIYAFEVAAKSFGLTEHPMRVGRAIEILAAKTGIYGMIGGQTVDVELTGRPMTKEQLDFVYRLKTGALLEASVLIGAVLAGAGEEEQQKAEQMARAVGMAFQIQDDILDVTGDEQVTGKPVGSDEKNSKTTYVTLEGLEGAKALVEEYSRQAIEILDGFPAENPFLRQLLFSLINRKN